ncbi:MAG: glycosyltransferase family 4 protein [Devosiaceae bacterium]|nr:glycosyltransferase family 4 protein [Devosiaceae bacterium]
MTQIQNQNRPLRILMILRAPVGGLYRHVIDLTDELSKRGHQVGLVMDSSHVDAQTDQRISCLQTPPALGVQRFPIPRLIGPADLSATLRIRSLAKKLKVDVLHGHGAKGGFNARLASLGRANTVATYTPHGGVLNYDKDTPVGRILRIIERMLLGFTDALLFESAFAKAAFEEQIGKVSCLGPVILNGLLPQDFTPLDAKLAEFDFAYVGELRLIKGINYMLDALVNVKRADGTGATLILGGGGPQKADLEQQIDQLGLKGRVTMVGVQPALSVFSRGRIAIMPSLAESLPYVALEAAGASKPLIATDVGGVKEIFGPTAPALLPAKSAGALYTAMQNTLDDPVAAQREMEVRLEWIKAHFSIKKMTDDIEQAYYECLQRAE